MSFTWIYDLSQLSLAFVIVGGTVAFSLVGLWATRPLVVRWLGATHSHNDLLANLLATIGVLYGITLGLVSIAAWEAYEAIGDSVEQEVAVAAAFHADVDLLPEPARTEIIRDLAAWRDYVVTESWPAQRAGIKPSRESVMLHQVERTLVHFEPRTASEIALHRAALTELNELVRLGMRRFEAVGGGLPGMLWWIVILGAVQLIGCTWLMSSTKLSVHYFSTAMVAGLLGLLIFFLAEVDNPIRGDFGITSEGFRELSLTPNDEAGH